MSPDGCDRPWSHEHHFWPIMKYFLACSSLQKGRADSIHVGGWFGSQGHLRAHVQNSPESSKEPGVMSKRRTVTCPKSKDFASKSYKPHQTLAVILQVAADTASYRFFGNLLGHWHHCLDPLECPFFP